MRRRQYYRYIDSEGYVHASGAAIAVNAGLCGNNDNIDYTDDPVDCRVCIEVDQHVRALLPLQSPPAKVEG